ncbi:MAG: hypothetical protein KBE65_20275 [Phycisphaerae bacterium]|nr:hypothetical protein [Phycisphaerae bacterium]
MKVELALCVGVCLLVLSAPSFADVLGFDDITTDSTAWIPDGYGGLNWDTFVAGKASAWQGSGYYNGLVSDSYVAYNDGGNPAEISGDAFNLTGAYLTAAWNDGLCVHIEGYRSDSLVYTHTAVVDTSGPQWADLDFINVDRVLFTSYGGTHNSKFSLYGTQFAMDNMIYSMYSPTGDWTPTSVEITPENPTSCNELTITVSGTSGSCPTPSALEVTVVENSVFVDVLRTIGDAGATVVVSWELSTSTGPLSPGVYTVYTRLCTTQTTTGSSSCTDYQSQMTFTVSSCSDSQGVCGGEIVAGDRVVLLEQVGDLLPGHSGTVMCKGDLGILVSWDQWSAGDGLADYCTYGPIADFPPSSACWIGGTAPQEKLGRFFDAWGVLVKGTECVLFQTDNGQSFVLDNYYGHTVGDYIRVVGLLRSPGISMCIQGEGCIKHTIMPSASADAQPCCGSSCGFRRGDRVVLLQDKTVEPYSSPDLRAGASGTILACDGNIALVSWDLVTDSDVILLDEGATWRDFKYPEGSMGTIELLDLGKYVDLGCVTPQWDGILKLGSVTYHVTVEGNTYTLNQVVYPNHHTNCFGLSLTDGENVHIRGIVDAMLTFCNWLISPCDLCTADFCQYERSGAGFSPSSIRAGQTLTLAFGGANCGTSDIPSGWTIRYYASLDTTITSSDYYLYEAVADFGIGAGVQLGLLEEFVFPSSVPAGQYYIGWIFDPDDEICESNENNNAGYIKTGRLTVGWVGY